MEENKKDKMDKPTTVFVACCILGVGIGFLIKNILAGSIIGVGVGFLARAFMSK